MFGRQEGCGEADTLSMEAQLQGWVHTQALLSGGMASLAPASACFKVDEMTLATWEKQAGSSREEFLSKLMLPSF